MTRLPGWQKRLTAYIAACARREFAPGQHDCALFAAGAVEAMTGEDLTPPGLREYSDIATGVAKLRAAGFRDHIALVAALLPEGPRTDPRPGDVAVVQDGEDMALGIVQGARVYVVGPAGLGLRPASDIVRVFRV
jgi:hypothetical protein